MDKKTKIILGVGVAVIALIATAWLAKDTIVQFALKPTDSTLPTVNTDNLPVPSASEPLETVVAENLKVPWEIAFLPDGSMLVTERDGALEKISPDRKTISNVSGVVHVGEGGLMGLAIHPDFAKNNFIYLCLTTRDNGKLVNRVERYQLTGDNLSGRQIILDSIPGSSNHDGGRLSFGPDGKLYLTTGDAENANLAQDKTSLAGKILRLNDDGSIPEDNPFGNAVFSYGHRNPQGLAWDSQGRLWSTEHGPSGSQTGNDELNLIEKGKNYGWPTIRGTQTSPGMEAPIVESGKSETWAPASLAYYKGSLIFTGLRGQSLYAGKIDDNNKVKLTAYLRQKYGRLRAVSVGPDGFIYVSTSNTDGRGKAQNGGDKIIKLNPSIFK